MIKPIVSQQEEVYKHLLDNLHSRYAKRITHVILFGSRAKGIAKPWSDYDFAIVLNEKDRNIVDGIYDIVTDSLLIFGADISLKIYSEKDFKEKKTKNNPFVNRILESGIELWT